MAVCSHSADADADAVLRGSAAALVPRVCRVSFGAFRRAGLVHLAYLLSSNRAANGGAGDVESMEACHFLLRTQRAPRPQHSRGFVTLLAGAEDHAPSCDGDDG